MSPLQSLAEGAAWGDEGSPEQAFDIAVAAFLRKVAAGETAAMALRDIPAFAPSVSGMSWDEALRGMSEGLRHVREDSLTGVEEVDVSVPLWRTCPLPLAIVFESLARA